MLFGRCFRKDNSSTICLVLIYSSFFSLKIKYIFSLSRNLLHGLIAKEFKNTELPSSLATLSCFQALPLGFTSPVVTLSGCRKTQYMVHVWV